MEALSPDDQRKLDVFITDGKGQLQTIDDIKEALRDAAKHLADEFGVKSKHLMDALRTAHKNNLDQKKVDMSTVEDILNATGHG